MADKQITVSATTDNKNKFNSFSDFVAAMSSKPWSLSFDSDCPKTLIEQVVAWLIQNPSKWPTDQLNFLNVDEPSAVPANQTYNKYDARRWRARLEVVKPAGWTSREVYVGPHGLFASNSLFKG